MSRALLSIAGALFLLSACGDGPPSATNPDRSTAPFAHPEKGHEGLLVAREELPGFLSSITGTLEIRDGCVVLDDGREARFVVWPKGSTWHERGDSIRVVHDDQSSTTYVLGRRYRLIGGGVSSFSGGSNGLAPPTNSKCSGPAWITSDLKPTGE